MKLQIIDASVAIKWFLEQENDKKKADEILIKIRDFPQNYAVPELFFNEMLSILCRVLRSPSLVHTAISGLEDLGFYRVGNGRELLKRATTLALNYQLSGYDAIYAATAELTDGVWITADLKAHQKIASLQISKPL